MAVAASRPSPSWGLNIAVLLLCLLVALAGTRGGLVELAVAVRTGAPDVIAAAQAGALDLAAAGRSRLPQLVALGRRGTLQAVVVAHVALDHLDRADVVPQSIPDTARAALDGLASGHVLTFELPDLADIPAMDPLLAQVIDPRPTATLMPSWARRGPVLPFQYDVAAGDTLADVAMRFGVSQAALLWNNGLDDAEQLGVGQRLTVLPVNGVLHLVRAGETAAEIAERYGARLVDLLEANGLSGLDGLKAEQILVVAGGAVPTPTTPHPTPLPTLLATLAPLLPMPIATPTAEPSHAGLVATAMDRPWRDLPQPPGATGWQRDFILSLAYAGRESQRLTGVPTSVTLAQAILESDWGRSGLARDAKNLFGIKARTRPGTAGVYNANTWEVFGGANVIVPDSFRAYASVADSVVDHGRWFHDQPRYAGALAYVDDPRAFAHAIAAAGYATDPAYAGKLVRLMDRFDLYAYDLETSPRSAP